MSIRAITFNEQLCTSEDDALIHDLFLNGHIGKLTGCAITNNSNSITIGTGYFMIAGRLVNINGEHIYLCHAGFTPWLKEDGGIKVPNPKGSDLIWDRDHYLETTSRGPWGNAIVVHGHTPIPYIWEDLRIPKEDQEMGALWYNANKVCIDTGAHWTHHTVLLNLDTWEEHIFQN